MRNVDDAEVEIYTVRSGAASRVVPPDRFGILGATNGRRKGARSSNGERRPSCTRVRARIQGIRSIRKKPRGRS